MSEKEKRGEKARRYVQKWADELAVDPDGIVHRVVMVVEFISVESQEVFEAADEGDPLHVKIGYGVYAWPDMDSEEVAEVLDGGLDRVSDSPGLEDASRIGIYLDDDDETVH